MGLFDIFTRTKRRDELLGEIAPLLAQAKKLTFTFDTSKSKLFTDIHGLTVILIRNHGNDPMIVEPVKTILQTLGNQGIPASHFVGIHLSAVDAYYDYKMNKRNKKNDTGLLREIEKLIVSRLDADNDFEILKDIQKTSPYALTRQECSEIILDLAQIQSINRNYKESFENIHLAFEYLQPEEQGKAIELINKNCLNMQTEMRDFESIGIYSDVLPYGIPKAVRYNMAYNFLILYNPSEIVANTRKEYAETVADIYSHSEEPELKNLAYQNIDKLAKLVAQKGDLDSSLNFRRTIMLRMENNDPLLPMAIAAWDKDIEKLEYPSEKFHKSIRALHANNGLHFSYASRKLVDHILYTANSLLDGIHQEKSDIGIKVAIDALGLYYSPLTFRDSHSVNDDLAATVIMNAYDRLDKKISYDDFHRIFHGLTKFNKLSPPITNRVVNTWNEAALSEAKNNPVWLMDGSTSILKDLKRDFIHSHQNDFATAKDMHKKLPVEQRIVMQGAVDNLLNTYEYLTKPRDKLTAAANIIDFTQRDDPRHQQAIAWYVETYKSAKANQEVLFETSEIFPKDTPKELKRMFKEVEALEKAKLQEKPPEPVAPKIRPTSPKAFLEDLKKEI